MRPKIAPTLANSDLSLANIQDVDCELWEFCEFLVE